MYNAPLHHYKQTHSETPVEVEQAEEDVSEKPVYNSNQIPPTFSISTPRSARDVVSTSQSVVSTHHKAIYNLPPGEVMEMDITEAMKGVATATDKQMKNLILALIKKYKDDQLEG
jgi:hypothetical protein